MTGIYKIDHANDAGRIVLHLLTGREMEFAIRDDGGNPEMWIYPKDMEESEIKQICDRYPKCNAYFLYDGAGLECGIAFASYDGWYGHVVNVVRIDGIWRGFDASAGKYADNTTSIIEAFDLYENRIQLN